MLLVSFILGVACLLYFHAEVTHLKEWLLVANKIPYTSLRQQNSNRIETKEGGKENF